MSELGIKELPSTDPDYDNLMNHFHDLVSNATGKKTNPIRFPGTMPLTLSRRHFAMVASNDYVVLEKSDGTRYMLLAVSSCVVLIDRRSRIYPLDPNPQILSKGYVRPQDNTILDGELTFNLVTQQWDYLIYDCIAIDGDLSVAKRGFRQRMQAAEAFVAGPRVWAPFCAGLLRLRIKDFYETINLRQLLQRIRKTHDGKYLYINNDRRDGVVCNENDGVIFSPVGMSYQIRNCPALLKWKPPHLNSVDFMLQLTKSYDSRRKEPSVKCTILYGSEGQRLRPLREVMFPSQLRRMFAANFDRYNNSIVELVYDRSGGEWAYLRQREDKQIPNFQSTVIDTLETISESVDREELVRFIERNSQPPPKHEKPFVETNAQNVAACTFRQDYFDDENKEYVLRPPISLVAPPVLPRPPNMPTRKGRANPRQGSNAQFRRNGPDGNEPNGSNGAAPEKDGARLPFQYDEDV